MHLTLIFLGEIAPAILPHITGAATRLCSDMQPFHINCNGLGIFGTRRNPKTIWAAVDPAPELMDLHENLCDKLKRYGYEMDKGDFRPHITLGRSAGRADNRELVGAMERDASVNFGAWMPRRLTIYESRMLARGPEYRVLAHIPFAGGRDDV